MAALLSDNVSGMHPAIAAAIADADRGNRLPYGDDDLSRRLDASYSQVFEKDVAVLPCVTGTAANSIAMALLADSYNSICVHADSHIYLWECSGPEFFTGGARQVPIPGEHGKINAASLEGAMTALGERDPPQPSAVSITQATEIGTLYQPDELRAITATASKYGLRTHIDGARFANAVAGLDCSPAEASWKAGVDILSLGATKNGCLAAEALVLFDPSLAREARYRAKQAGQMLSKQRYLAAQLLTYVEDDLWLETARHANRHAAALADRLAAIDGVDVLPRDDTNMVYARIPEARVVALQEAGAAGHIYENGYMRLICSWATSDADIDQFVSLLQS